MSGPRRPLNLVYRQVKAVPEHVDRAAFTDVTRPKLGEYLIDLAQRFPGPPDGVTVICRVDGVRGKRRPPDVRYCGNHRRRSRTRLDHHRVSARLGAARTAQG